MGLDGGEVVKGRKAGSLMGRCGGVGIFREGVGFKERK